MIMFKEITYKSFGRRISVNNGEIELMTTLDFGPRIFRFAEINGENVILENENKVDIYLKVSNKYFTHINYKN